MAFAAGMLALLLGHIPFVATLEHITMDWRMRSRKADPTYGQNIVLIIIDEAALQGYPCRSPVPREMLAKMIRFLSSANTRLIGLDVFLKDPGWEETDADLVNAMREHGGVVIGSIFRKDLKFSLDLPHPKFLEAALAIGLVEIPVDPVDGVVREYKSFFDIADQSLPTLATSLYLIEHGSEVGEHKFSVKKGWEGAWPPEILLDAAGRFYINYQAPPSSYQAQLSTKGSDSNPLKVFPASAVLTGFLPAEWFQESIVLIGAGFTESKDAYPTPYYSPTFDYVLTPGVEIHANALATLLSEKSLIFPALTTHSLLLFLASLIVIFAVFHLRALIALAVLLGVGTGYTFMSYRNFIEHDIAFTLVPFWLGLGIAYIEGIGYKAATEGRQKRWIKQAFARYVSSDVVNLLVRDPNRLHLGGETRELSILFSDLANFTGIAEGLSPEELVALLNRYFDGATEIILKHGGTLDKYIGDSIMAFWNAPLFQEDHALQAAQAALEIQAFSEQFNNTLTAKGNSTITTRIGLNTGKAVVGNIGAHKHFNYTAMGDAVNLASRLEGANKVYGTTIMISEFMYERIRQAVHARELDLLRVKGKEKTVRVYELQGVNEQQPSESIERMVRHYQQGLIAYREKNWQTAMACFERAVQHVPMDRPSLLYLERCKQMQAFPPEENWDGVYIMRTK